MVRTLLTLLAAATAALPAHAFDLVPPEPAERGQTSFDLLMEQNGIALLSGPRGALTFDLAPGAPATGPLAAGGSAFEGNGARTGRGASVTGTYRASPSVRLRAQAGVAFARMEAAIPSLHALVVERAGDAFARGSATVLLAPHLEVRAALGYAHAIAAPVENPMNGIGAEFGVSYRLSF